MDTSFTLFISDRSSRSLQAVAQDAFAALGIIEFEERFSSNYPPDDHHFAGYALNVVVDVFDVDEIKPGYPYALSVETPTYRRGKNIVPADPTAVALALAKAGFRVFVPEGTWGRREWDGTGAEYVL